MPRKLPWASSSTTTRPKRPTSTPATKRQKVRRTSSDSEEERSMASSKKGSSLDQGRHPSSSPPPDPPPESFMEEGQDNDDRYRMVEDEFLRVAQQFTVNLHAAEYKRQQKAVKSQNADTINSISRPVTGKMPDQTRRKLQAAALAKRQRAIIKGLKGKTENGADSDSDIEELPYVGTTLHGLMDSPRKKAASIAKLGSTATTRAAAGFRKPAVQSNVDQHKSLMDSPEPKHAIRRAQADLAVDSTDDDDDLDAPIPAPKLIAPDRKPVMPSSLHASSIPSKPTTNKKEPLVASSHMPKSRPFNMAESSTTSTSTVVTTTGDIADAAPKPSRLERIRMARAKKEKEQQIKKEEDYNSIPTF